MSELMSSRRPTQIAAILLACLSLPLFAPAATAYFVDMRWSTTASGSTGSTGSPIKLTWSIVPNSTAIPMHSASSLITFLDTNFGAGPGGADLTKRPWFPYFSQSFDRWSQLSGVTFVYEPNDNGSQFRDSSGVSGIRGDVRIAGANIDGVNGTLAQTYYPNSGDMLIDTSDGVAFSDPTSNHLELRNTITHEAGHALGLKHVVSGTNGFLMAPSISTSFDGPQIDDILGVQSFYGDAFEKSNSGQGNDTTAHATSLGAIAVGAMKSIGTSGASQLVSATATDFVSIDSSTDIDFYSFSVAGPTRLSAMLTPQGGTYMQGPEGGSQSSFNASAQSDLALAIYATNGTTQLASANITGAGLSESLSNVSLASAGAYYVRVTGATAAAQLYELQLSVAVPYPSGDYNHNGVVDAADYTVWRDSLRRTGSGLAADGNANGQIDADDYTVWKTHFGATNGSGSFAGSEVPEPAAVLLAVVAGLGLFVRPLHLCSFVKSLRGTAGGPNNLVDPPFRRGKSVYGCGGETVYNGEVGRILTNPLSAESSRRDAVPTCQVFLHAGRGG